MTKIPSVKERVEEVTNYIVDLSGYGQALHPNDINYKIREALTAEREAGAREERVFVLQPQWVDESPAWLCILTKDDGVIAEKVFTQPELRSAYLQKTGQYASTVITTYEAKIGALYLLKSLTPPIK